MNHLFARNSPLLLSLSCILLTLPKRESEQRSNNNIGDIHDLLSAFFTTFTAFCISVGAKRKKNYSHEILPIFRSPVSKQKIYKKNFFFPISSTTTSNCILQQFPDRKKITLNAFFIYLFVCRIVFSSFATSTNAWRLVFMFKHFFCSFALQFIVFILCMSLSHSFATLK